MGIVRTPEDGNEEKNLNETEMEDTLNGIGQKNTLFVWSLPINIPKSKKEKGYQQYHSQKYIYNRS